MGQGAKSFVPGECLFGCVAWIFTATRLQHDCNTHCNTATQRCNLQGKPALLMIKGFKPFRKRASLGKGKKHRLHGKKQRCVAMLQCVLQSCCSESPRNTARVALSHCMLISRTMYVPEKEIRGAGDCFAISPYRCVCTWRFVAKPVLRKK